MYLKAQGYYFPKRSFPLLSDKALKAFPHCFKNSCFGYFVTFIFATLLNLNTLRIFDKLKFVSQLKHV